jgi:ribosomal protein S18 acetylase RimI-like enzyme
VAALVLDDDEIETLAVDVKHQRKGYGTEMMALAINKIIDDGCDQVELWVHCRKHGRCLLREAQLSEDT